MLQSRERCWVPRPFYKCLSLVSREDTAAGHLFYSPNYPGGGGTISGVDFWVLNWKLKMTVIGGSGYGSKFGCNMTV
jgi:hypothetical protein